MSSLSPSIRPSQPNTNWVRSRTNSGDSNTLVSVEISKSTAGIGFVRAKSGGPRSASFAQRGLDVDRPIGFPGAHRDPRSAGAATEVYDVRERIGLRRSGIRASRQRVRQGVNLSQAVGAVARPAEPINRLAVAGPNQEVEVIGHEAISVEAERRSILRPGNRLEERLMIRIVGEEVSAILAAADVVLDQAVFDDAEEFAHLGRPTGRPPIVKKN